MQVSNLVPQLLNILNKEGIKEEEIECIVQCGSSLYFDDIGDLDFIVFTPTKYALGLGYEIDGVPCDIISKSSIEWRDVLNQEYEPFFLDECMNWKTIYGDSSKIKKYDPLTDERVRKVIMKFYDRRLFCKEPITQPKRLYCFLRFAYILENKSFTYTERQLKEMLKAKKGLISKEKYRPLFDYLKEQILGGKNYGIPKV